MNVVSRASRLCDVLREIGDDGVPRDDADLVAAPKVLDHVKEWKPDLPVSLRDGWRFEAELGRGELCRRFQVQSLDGFGLGGFGYGSGWVDAALALFVLVGVLGVLGGQRPKRGRKLAARLAREGNAESDELRGLLNDRLALVLNYLAAVLLVAIIVLMVFKPGSRG